MSTRPGDESRAPYGPSGMLGASDWDDEDLLTIAEASERLAQEVSRSRNRARMIQDLLDSGEHLDVERSELLAQVDAETRRADELADAAARITAGQANAPVPRR